MQNTVIKNELKDIKFDYDFYAFVDNSLNFLVNKFNKKNNLNIDSVYYVIELNQEKNKVIKVWVTEDDYFKTDKEVDQYYLIFNFTQNKLKDRLKVNYLFFNRYYRFFHKKYYGTKSNIFKEYFLLLKTIIKILMNKNE